MLAKRVGTSLILIAISALLVSGLATLPYTPTIILWQHPSEGLIFHAIGDVSVNLEIDHGNGTVSLYILDFNALAKYQENGTLNRSTTIFFAEDLVGFSSIIPLPGPSDYGLVLLTTYEGVLTIRLRIANVWPPTFLLPLLVTLISPGVVLLVVGRIPFRRKA
jgi:hypothetical protein